LRGLRGAEAGARGGVEITRLHDGGAGRADAWGR
jgi:hypothetical protein